MIYKTFDFGHPDFKKNCPETQQFLQEAYGKNMGEDEFVERYMSLSHNHKRKHVKPHHARRHYQRLKERFNFFEVQS